MQTLQKVTIKVSFSDVSWNCAGYNKWILQGFVFLAPKIGFGFALYGQEQPVFRITKEDSVEIIFWKRPDSSEITL